MKNALIISLLWLMTGLVFAQDVEKIKEELESQKPVKLSGSLGVGGMFYGVKGIDSRQPAQLMLSGNVNVSVYGWNIPVSANFSNQQLNISYRQPFNQFGMSPSYKWIKLHAGYRNVTYSPFTLAGHTFLGAGIELTPKKWRFGAVYGRFLKATLENEALNNTTELFDKVTFSAYERRAFVAKLGYGTEINHFDVIVLKGYDRMGSLPESQQTNAVSPSENLVVGVSPRFTFFKKIEWKTDLGLSLFTRDVRSEKVSINELPLTKTLAPVFTVRTSTHYYLAGESALKIRLKKSSLGVKYRRVDPDYKSMGAYFFQTDFQQWLITPAFSAFKSKLNFTGSAGIQRDNLLNTKAATTHRNIYSANLNWQASEQLGLDLQFSNFGISQAPGIRKLTDTVRIAQITRSITFSPHYLKVTENHTHSVMVVSSYQELIDRNPFTSSFGGFTFHNHNLTYIFSNQKNGLSFTGGVNYNKIGMTLGQTEAWGLTGSVAKTFFKNTLTTDLSTSYNLNKFDGKNNGSTLGGGLNLTYTPTEKHTFSANGNFLRNTSYDETISPNFTEFIGQLQYTLSF